MLRLIRVNVFDEVAAAKMPASNGPSYIEQ
jgi:hypothetical protein